MVEIQGYVVREIYSGPKSSITSIKVSHTNSPDIKVGSYVSVLSPNIRTTPGMMLQCVGDYSMDDRFGAQLKSKSITKLQPKADYSNIANLRTFTLTQKPIVRALFSKFGAQTFEKLNKEPAQTREILSEITFAKQSVLLKKLGSVEGAFPTLSVFIAGNHNLRTANFVWEKYGSFSADLFGMNPYSFSTRIAGLSFTDIDNSINNNSLQVNQSLRISSFIDFAIQRAKESGDIGVERNRLKKLISTYLSFDDETTERIVAYHEKHTYKLSEFGDKKIFMTHLDYNRCNKIRDNLSRLLDTASQTNAIKYPDFADKPYLNKEQKEAVINSLKHKVSIITGGPGVGKTTVLKSVLEAVEQNDPDAKFILCAPTGKASVRMAESTGREAKTIHKTLQPNQEGRFSRNASNHIDGNVFVIDEFSMVDEILFHNFLSALPDDAKLIMIGDPDQLPSVGFGQVLSDLINSGLIPTTNLHQVMRQKGKDGEISQIVKFSRSIMSQNPESEIDLNALKQGEVIWLDAPDPDASATDRHKAILDSFVRNVTKLIDIKGVDPDEIQFLTPMRKGILGVNNLNKVMRDIFNRTEDKGKFAIERFDKRFEPNDRIIFMRNNMDKGFSNGDTGKITFIDKTSNTLKVRLDRESESEEIIELKASDLDIVELSYAKTIHKSQGSEYRVVFMPVISEHANMLNPEIIYTGATRAKELLVMQGEQDAFYKGVSNDSIEPRKTMLKDLLSEVFENEMTFSKTTKGKHEAEASVSL